MADESLPHTSSDEQWLPVGHIVRPQGLKGAFRVNPLSGDPDSFVHYRQVQIDGTGVRRITSARTHKNQAILQVEGFDSIEAVEALRGCRIQVRRSELPEPGEDEYYWNDLIGCRVIDRTQGEVGTVKAVVDFGAHDNLVLERSDGKEAQVPFVDAMVLEVSLENRRIEVDLPEGLLDV